ncbi:unnamed protein product, partial [marine sediment metagenome]
KKVGVKNLSQKIGATAKAKIKENLNKLQFTSVVSLKET